MHLDRYKASGAELIMGEARFISPRTVEVSLNSGGTKRIAGERVFLNLGTLAAVPDWPGLVEAKPLTHVEAPTLTACQEILDFPPAPKPNIYGKLDPKKATEAELKGQEIFFGKAQCAVCHIPPHYTNNLMHNLKAERFFKPF